MKDVYKYVWILPPGSGFSASSIETTTPEIVVDVSNGTGGKIGVYALSNACGGGKTPTSYTPDITIHGEPQDFHFTTAQTAACGIGDTLRFAVNEIPGITGYTWTFPAALSEEIVDDNGPDQTKVIRNKPSGSWWLVHSDDGYNGTFIEARNYGTQTSISFIGDLPYDGIYKVYLYNPVYSGWSTTVPVNIVHKRGKTVLNFVGNNYTRGWIDLGNYEFVQGRFDTVTIGAPLSGQTVFYDAIRFVYQPFTDDTSFTFKVINHKGGPVCVTASVPSCHSGYTICSDPINTTGKLLKPTILQSPLAVCAGQSYTYVCSDIGAGAYHWILPAGISLNGQTGTVLNQSRSITIRIDTFLTNPVKIGVYGTIAGCGVSSDTAWSADIAMSANLCPLADPIFNRNYDTVCAGSVKVFSIIPIPRAEQYEWSLPDGITHLETGKAGTITTSSPSINVVFNKTGLLNSILVKAFSSKQPASNAVPSGAIFSLDATPSITIAPEATCPDDTSVILIRSNPLFTTSTTIQGARWIDSTRADSLVVVWSHVSSGSVSVTSARPSLFGCAVTRNFTIDLSGGETTITCPADISETIQLDTAIASYTYTPKDTLKPTVSARCGFIKLFNDFDSSRNDIAGPIQINIPPRLKKQSTGRSSQKTAIPSHALSPSTSK